MKKMLSLLMAVLMLCTLCTTAFAVNITESGNHSANMSVEYGISASYTVTIPNQVTLDPDAGTRINVSVTDALLESGKALYMYIDAAGWNDDSNTSFLVNANDANDTLEYSIEYRTVYDVWGPEPEDCYEEWELVDVNTWFARHSTHHDDSYAFMLTMISEPTKAGTYTDTLTFTVDYSDLLVWAECCQVYTKWFHEGCYTCYECGDTCEDCNSCAMCDTHIECPECDMCALKCGGIYCEQCKYSHYDEAMYDICGMCSSCGLCEFCCEENQCAATGVCIAECPNSKNNPIHCCVCGEDNGIVCTHCGEYICYCNECVCGLHTCDCNIIPCAECGAAHTQLCPECGKCADAEKMLLCCTEHHFACGFCGEIKSADQRSESAMEEMGDPNICDSCW